MKELSMIGVALACGMISVFAADAQADAFAIPRAEYAKYHEAITGAKPAADAVRFAIDPAISKRGNDAYAIRSDAKGAVLTGSNMRSVLYAVYDLLERRGGCRWFWDGDVVPKASRVDLSGLDVREEAQFRYRGLRYFAHRGLTRFQAEHWGPEEWERELDWVLKNRFNIALLRIGQDDVFQRAFPKDCPYPDPAKPLRGAGKGYDNRSLFWPLEFRGKLRERLVAYGTARGIMFPEDCGVMTHWYSATPVEFLESRKPKFFSQTSSNYKTATGLIWDIRIPEWYDAYWKITDTAVSTYDAGQCELLHAMGPGERRFSTDPVSNFNVKCYMNTRICRDAAARYPKATILRPGWDFYATWTADEVKRFLPMLDWDRCVLWDYEADAYEPKKTNFTEWDVIGKYPYVFGIFLAYESGLDIRADYDLIRKRQRLIQNDPMCKGYVICPESSHTDILALRYVVGNSWKAHETDIGAMTAEFCRDRYGAKAAAFEKVWNAVVPISAKGLLETWRSNYGQHLVQLLGDEWDNCANNPAKWPMRGAATYAALPQAFRDLAALAPSGEFECRDAVDLARTAGDRLTQEAEAEMMRAYLDWKAGKPGAKERFERAAAFALRFAKLMARILAQHTDYSLNDSLERLDRIEKVRNPDFGQVLLENAVNSYCASHQAEPAEHLYPELIELTANEIRTRMSRGDKTPLSHKPVKAKINAFLARRLETLRPRTPRSPEALRAALSDFAAAADEFVKPVPRPSAASLTLRPGAVEIVTGKTPAKVVSFAAKELQTFLSQTLGAEVPVVGEASNGKSHIFLGAAATGLKVGDFARDAFRLAVDGKDVRIAGRDDPKANPERALDNNIWSNMYERATVFGVYEFLERFVGVRFYFPGELGTVVQRRPAVEIPAMDVIIAPDWPSRSYSYGADGVWFEGEDRSPKATRRIRHLNAYRLRMQTRYLPFCHGQNHRGYVARFSKTHPEYFLLNEDGTRDMRAGVRMGGQLCHTSGIWEEIYQDAKSYLMGEDASVRGIVAPNGKHAWWYGCQDRKYVDVMPQDGMRRCACPKCQAAYENDAANYADTLIWGNMAKAANRLIEEGVPGYLCQMAYRPYRKVPSVELPTNILVQVAERGPWAKVSPKGMKKDNAEIAAWRKKLGQRIPIWNYPCKYKPTDILDVPCGTPNAWAEYYTTVAPMILGAYAESHSDRFLHNHLTYYVFSRIAWNNQVDAKAVIDEHYKLMYGPAAGEMKTIFESFEDKWLNGVLGKPVDTERGPVWRPADAKTLSTSVYSPAYIAEITSLFDRAAAKVKSDSLEARRIALMRREIFDPLRIAAAEGFAGRYFKDRKKKAKTGKKRK